MPKTAEALSVITDVRLTILNSRRPSPADPIKFHVLRKFDADSRTTCSFAGNESIRFRTFQEPRNLSFN